MTDALVLSGGSIKGAYQAGVIAGLTAAGVAPANVTGISVGALNAAWLAAFPNDGEGLAEFWRTRITAPDALVKKRGFLDLAYRVVAKRWKGVVDTDPMAKLVREVLGPHLPVQPWSTVSEINTGPIDRSQYLPTVMVGVVNLRTGGIEYIDSTSVEFLEAVISSTAEPITMPLRQMCRNSDWYYDGGLRDIAPLKQAISLGATRIVVVLCQPPKLSEFTGDAGDVLSLASRVAGICADEILANDIARAEEVNMMVRSSLRNYRALGHEVPPDKRVGVRMENGKTYREIDIRVIRPAVGFSVDVASFTASDIGRMVDQGWLDGQLAGEGL
jgi:NTE family protein